MYLCRAIENGKIMATIMLKYNTRNRIATKTIDYILSLGVFEKAKPEYSFVESDNDIAYGRVYEAKDANDLIKQCLE